MVEHLLQKTGIQSLGQEYALEKGMETRSRTLAWRISWTERPGGLHPQSLKDSDTTELNLHNVFETKSSGF